MKSCLLQNHFERLKKFKSIKDIIENSSLVWPNEIAFEFSNNKVTYSQLKSDIVSFEKYLRTKGVSKGDKVVILSTNSYEWILTYLTVIIMDAIIVPIDVELPFSQISDLLIELGIKNIVCSKKHAEKIEMFSVEHKVNNIIFTNDILTIIQNQKLPFDEANFEKNIYYDENKVCQISFTSGTTGKIKAIGLTNKNIISDVIGISEIVKPNINTSVILILPLNHMFAVVASLLVPLTYGLKIFICKSKKYFLRDISNVKPKWLVVVPSIIDSIYRIVNQGNVNTAKMLLNSGIEFIVTGGAILGRKYEDFFEKTGIKLINGYGITECSPVVTVNRLDCICKGSCGIPLSCCSIKINNPDANGIGEILVSGDNVMSGYYDNETDTKKAFDGDWFKTGDLGYIDDKGYLFITGRLKNLIILDDGNNVSAEELENLLQANVSNINEVIVYEKDNKITAEIFTESKDIDKIKTDIKGLNKSLPIYKQIQSIVFRQTEFPKTSTLKIKR